MVYDADFEIAGYSAIKDGVLGALSGSEYFSPAQKIAIRLAAETLPAWAATDGRISDGPLRGIMQITWPDIGVEDTDAAPLVPELRLARLILQAASGV